MEIRTMNLLSITIKQAELNATVDFKLPDYIKQLRTKKTMFRRELFFNF